MFLPKVIRKESKKIPVLLEQLHLPSSHLALNIAQRSRVNTLVYPLGILQKKKMGEIWSERSAKDKQPYEQKAAKVKEKNEKDIAAFHAKDKSEVGKKAPGRPTGSKKKDEPEDEEEEDKEEEEDED
ncbi:hypothetical protein HJG60_008003 [Phyllostomus discolor]|uniref:HMG box domain-containing protein n=1 Tax=Phyllostomus discolor TaxID=89673 RepID=A0A834BI09_9CHIR|nr:hypothetical protein HJG60_008003 [Phyllostomus discolor]